MVLPELDLKKLKVYKIAKKVEEDISNNKVTTEKLKAYVKVLKQEKRTFDFVCKTDNLYSKSFLTDIFKLYSITSKSYLKMTLALAQNTMKNPKVVKVTPVDAAEESRGEFLQYTFTLIVPEDFDAKKPHTVKELSNMVKKDNAFVVGYTSKLVKEEELLATPQEIEESHKYSLPLIDTLSSRKLKKAIIEDVKAGRVVDDYKKYIVAYTKTMGMITELAVKKVTELKTTKHYSLPDGQKKKVNEEIKDLISLTK